MRPAVKKMGKNDRKNVKIPRLKMGGIRWEIVLTLSALPGRQRSTTGPLMIGVGHVNLCCIMLYPALGIGFSLTCSVLIYTKIKILALYIEGKGEHFDNATILGILRGLKYLRGFWTNK